MRLCVIPMKPLEKSKQRLSEVFNPQQRKELSLAMLADVIDSTSAADETWVICSDDEAREVAKACGARPVTDRTPDAGLNASLAATTSEAVEAKATGMLILSADCPAATSEDVQALLLGPGVALAPDLSMTGTNALWRSPCDAIPPTFGRMSRRAHQGLAYASRIPFARVPRQNLALDADTPRDLHRLLLVESATRTRDVLEKVGYARGNGGR